MKTPTHAELLDDLLSDPGQSFWLKYALRTAQERDPVDVLYEAKTLVFLCECRVAEAGFIFSKGAS